MVTKGTIDTRELCKAISEKCSLNVADMKAAIEALAQTIEDKLQDGYNVSIDESRTVQDSEEIRGQSVKVKNINFRPSVRHKTTMKTSKFERVSGKK